MIYVIGQKDLNKLAPDNRPITYANRLQNQPVYKIAYSGLHNRDRQELQEKNQIILHGSQSGKGFILEKVLMSIWKNNIDNLDKLFVVWAFLFQVILIIHFAVRKPLFESYTTKYGWIVYVLCLPAVVISIILLRGGKSWPFWLGGFLFLLFASFGYWIDYVLQIPWRNPLQLKIMFPYVFLYLATVMFYWWPVGLLSRPLWFVYAILFVIGTVLNVTSHKAMTD